ncbi:MAG: zf-HC2 domain-containing protein [Candidatus Aminicenantes bacterium]|nr:zf-HC2 domain-containing protein [Candidatus Aminicenantes bacterium]MDH5662316.1 zf-HC2 domain-containing protein [Elusimicrobiota bacterium]
MSCKKFKIFLSAYIDQEITKDEQEKLLEHLKTCSACTRELKYLKQMKRIFLLKEKKEPQEFFETRLFARIRSKRERLAWRAYLPVFKKSILAVLIFFLLVVGLLNYRNFLYQRPAEIISDLLIDTEIEENFEEELLEIYYGPLG